MKACELWSLSMQTDLLFETLSTPEFLIRRLQEGDLAAWVDYRQHPEITMEGNWPEPFTLADALRSYLDRKTFDAARPGQERVGLILRREDEVVIGEWGLFTDQLDPQKVDLSLRFLPA